MFEQRDALTAEISRLKGQLDKGAPPKAEVAPPTPAATKVRAPAGAAPRKVDEFGVLRVCVQAPDPIPRVRIRVRVMVRVGVRPCGRAPFGRLGRDRVLGLG